MTRRILALAALFICAPAFGQQTFTTPGLNVIGRGSTTFAYLDFTGKPCGTGMRSSGQYPVWTASPPATGTTAWWTMGDLADPDPTDHSICGVTQWQSKYGWVTPETTGNDAANNAAMVKFLIDRKGYSNAAWGCTGDVCSSPRIFYISCIVTTNCSSTASTSPAGNDATAVMNEPSHPYATMAALIGTGGSPGPLRAVTAEFSGTATLVSGSNVITIASGSGLHIGDEITDTGLHIPSLTFIWGQLSGTSGGAGRYVMTKTATATVSTPESVTGSYIDGGVVVFRGGVWTSSAISMNESLESWELSGSIGHPLKIMAYPGEVVHNEYLNTTAFSALGSNYAPGFAAGYVDLDGIEWDSTKFYTGTGIKIAHFTNMTIENSEFAGYDDGIETAPEVRGLTIKDNVFHEIAAHSIYVAFGNAYYPAPPPNYLIYCDTPAQQDFNFAVDEQNYLNGTSCGSNYQVDIIDNLFYDEGDSGLDPVHVNAWVDQTTISGNIVSFVGGSAIDLQTGNYNTNAIGNLAFAVGASCFELFLQPYHPNPLGSGGAPATNRWNTFSGNLCYQQDSSLHIWGNQANAAIMQESQEDSITASLSTVSGNPIMTVTTFSGTDVGMFMTVTGTGISAGTTILPFGTYSTTGTGGTGTYALSQAVTTEPSETIIGQNPVGTAIKDTTFQNNIIVTNDNNSNAGLPIQFNYNTYPETDAFTGNTFWSDGATQNRMMLVTSDASTVATVPAGTYNFAGTGTCSVANGFNSCFSGNFYASPATGNSAWNAASSLYQTPGAFNFGKYNLH